MIYLTFIIWYENDTFIDRHHVDPTIREPAFKTHLLLTTEQRRSLRTLQAVSISKYTVVSPVEFVDADHMDKMIHHHYACDSQMNLSYNADASAGRVEFERNR